jgi:hypothetical protein
MAAKKRTKKKQKKSTSKKPAKRSAARKMKPTKKVAKKNPVSKKKSLRKKRKPAQRKPAVKAKAVRQRTKLVKPIARPKKRRKIPIAAGLVFSSEGSRSGSGGQSGDLQGLSGIAGADSESVDELVEEGNAFEADVVAGVEEAGDEGEKEVRTREVPEDDVPDEYLEKD